MVSRADQLTQLHKLKTARRRSAEMRALVARQHVNTAAKAVEDAHALITRVIVEGEQAKHEKLKEIFSAERDHSEHQINAVMVHFSTAEQIVQANKGLELAQAVHAEAQNRAIAAQKEMARAVQNEAKVEALAELEHQRVEDEAVDPSH